MDLDQTQTISDYEEEEEEKVEEDKANTKKKEVAYLKVFSQQGFKEETFPVFQGDNVIGRDRKSNITVPIKALSKKHACIEVQRDLHLIYDCGSKNRTKKGKSFLKPTIRYELKHGDMLTLGDVKCQYLVGLDMEEEDEDETGSETESESMLQEVNTEEESDVDKPVVMDGASTSKKMDENGSNALVQPTEDHQITKPTKDDEEAYAADTDSDTDDEERPIAVAAMATVLYSSEDEQAAPRRPQVSSVPSKENSSMEGQTLAFGLGSPANVFQSRDSTGSSGSHPGQTASIPPTLVLSSDSDSQSNQKLDVSSNDDHKTGTFKCPGPRSSDDSSPRKRPGHPEARIPGKGPSCDPTLLYGSESDDGSPIKRPRHPEAGVLDKDPSCEPTLLYGSESDDGTPKKRLKQHGASNEPTFVYESDADEDTSTVVAPIESDTRGESHHAGLEQTLLYSNISEEKPSSLSDKGSGNVAEDRIDGSDVQLQATAVVDADVTLPYVEAEMSSTDDEDELGADVNDKETLANAEPTLACNAEETKTDDSTDDELENLDADDFGADIATQAYAAVDDVGSDSETESEPIPLESGHTAADKTGANQAGNPSDLEATQAYCLEDEDSNSSDSQPLLIGTATATRDDISATMAYGLDATQAYNISEKVGDSSEDEDEKDKEQMPVYDLQATQAYGVGDDDDDTRESHSEIVEKQSANMNNVVNDGDTVQPTIPYGLEATQAYGADEETDDEDVENEDRSSTGGDQGRGDANAATLAYGLAPTQPFGGDDVNDDSDENGNNKADKDSGNVRQDNLATLPFALEETQAYDGDNKDTDSAQNSTIEATQAYGIEEASETESEGQQSKGGTKQTNMRRVAFSSTSTEVPQVDETEDDASAADNGGEGKPSTSTDLEDYPPDSEDFIAQSRSKRGRKKPAIKESQDEACQQLDKFGEAGNKTESIVASSSVGTTDQIEEASDMPEGMLKKNNKTAARKGRRGAMRVTIEPEEPEEEETRENLTRRGQKGVVIVTNETQEKEDDIQKETSTAGRKRGRQTMKTASALMEEEKEVSVTKSRRGRKANQLQADTTSVSETPPKTPTDTARVQEVTDSEPATVVVEEPLIVRRGGRGRGRKGVMAKETVTMEDQGEELEVSGTSVEPQPESLVEAKSTKGKGKGKGRGKKSQPSNNESMATESVDAEVFAISEDIQPQQAITTPARGRGRGKGRGKKAQPTPSTDQELGTSSSSSFPYSVPETPAINNEELPLPGSPAIAAASKGKGRGRQGRGKKAQHVVTELEAEETSQPESGSSSRESSQTRKGRSKGKMTRQSTEQNSDILVALSESTEFSETIADSEESSTPGTSKGSRRGRQRKGAMEDSESVVEETPAKKGRRGKEPSVVRSPSLNRARLPGESKPRIMFTGLVDRQGEKVVTNLGGQLVDNIHNCTHLVTDKVRRTVKFLCGLASGQVIVLPSWLDACKKAKSFVDPSPFFVKDKDAENQHKFTLQRSHEVALTKGLLEGYKIHVTKKVKPEPSQMKDIIQSAKGEFLSSMPRSKDDRVFVISCEEDKSVCKKPLEAGIPVVSAEVLLTGVLRQELDLEEHKLFADDMSDTSQDKASSGGQSKRRRETETGASSSSTAETKSTGSKRRKR